MAVVVGAWRWGRGWNRTHLHPFPGDRYHFSELTTRHYSVRHSSGHSSSRQRHRVSALSPRLAETTMLSLRLPRLPAEPTVFPGWLATALGDSFLQRFKQKSGVHSPSKERSSSACRANLSGLAFLSFARFCSFQRLAGSSAKCRHSISCQSGSPATRPSKNPRWYSVSAEASADLNPGVTGRSNGCTIKGC